MAHVKANAKAKARAREQIVVFELTIISFPLDRQRRRSKFRF